MANGWKREEVSEEIKYIEQKVNKEEFCKLRNRAEYEEQNQKKKEVRNSQLRMVLPFSGPTLAHKIRWISKKFDVLSI